MKFQKPNPVEIATFRVPNTHQDEKFQAQPVPETKTKTFLTRREI
jgi:hypothetical protein